MTTTRVSAKERILEAAQSLVYEHGFSATSIDSILREAGASKGAFFHHFSSKEVLGHALLERYAARDEELLEEFMTTAEAASDDPGEQALIFLRRFEEVADDISEAQPGCLFVSFIYERGPDIDDGLIVSSIESWRDRLLGKLTLAAESYPRLRETDLTSLSNLVFTVTEGAFILARATGEASHFRSQISQLRNYFELLLEK